jgi:hypothetical protein
MPRIDFLGDVANAVAVEVGNMQLRQHLGHCVQVIPLTRNGRLGPPGDTRRHELVLPAAAEVTAFELLHRIAVEHVGGQDLDRVCYVVRVAAACLIDRRVRPERERASDMRTISAVLENILVSNRFVRRIAADLDGAALNIKDGIALDHQCLTGGPALPVVLAIPFVAVAMHVNLVGLPAKSLDDRTNGASNGCTRETAKDCSGEPSENPADHRTYSSAYPQAPVSLVAIAAVEAARRKDQIVANRVAAVVHARFNYVAVRVSLIGTLAIACDRVAIFVENIAFDQRIGTAAYDSAIAKTGAVAIVVKIAIADADRTTV